MIALAAWARDRIVVVAGETWVRRTHRAWSEVWWCARIQMGVGRDGDRWFGGGPYAFDRSSRDSAMGAAVRWRQGASLPRRRVRRSR